ncbi:MAG: hypothetical protein ACYDG2_01735 [Ruminiclostridium sp.]
MSKKMIREEVEKFAQAMEIELKENDYKDGWKDCDLEFLIDKLEEEKDELLEVATRYDSIKYDSRVPEEEKGGLRKIVISEAADVGNIAMMIADICNSL